MSELTEKLKNDYSADNIQVLEGLEAVRKRPAMYIGDIGVRGLHHLVWEVVDNSIDEALAGHCTDIYVYINEDNSVTVSDNGRGIPTGIHTKENRSALEVVMTVLHAGGKFDKDTYKVSGGLHGVGVSCVNALSSHLKVTVQRDGKIFEQEYAKGIPQYKVRVVGDSDKTGTEVHFMPDSTVFTESVYKYDTVANRLRELSFLNKGIKIYLKDYREKDEEGNFIGETFFSLGGLREFVEYLDSTREKLIPEPMYMESDKGNIPVEVALHYNTSYTENVFSYVNNINTIEGGGCSGLMYNLNFDEAINPADQIFEDKGIKILVDKKSLLYLIGTTLDFSDGLNGKGFQFINPNASRTCGCGESFAV